MYLLLNMLYLYYMYAYIYIYSSFRYKNLCKIFCYCCFMEIKKTKKKQIYIWGSHCSDGTVPHARARIQQPDVLLKSLKSPPHHPDGDWVEQLLNLWVRLPMKSALNTFLFCFVLGSSCWLYMQTQIQLCNFLSSITENWCLSLWLWS